MQEPKRIEMNICPNSIEKLGNGTYYYNYDIKSAIVEISGQETTKQETRWNFIQVHLYGQPNYKECIKAIIREYVDQDEEFDLINSSNSIVLGLSDNNSDKQNYLDYLNLVNQIKVNVKNDFNN